MPSIKFTETELEFVVGQYELELIEAEKYISEIRNILKKLGVISKDISGKNEIKKKRGRGRPAKAVSPEARIASAEKSSKTKKKKKGKPGRPKKRGPKKGSKRTIKPSLKPVESKVPLTKAAAIKPAVKIPVKKSLPSKPSPGSKKQTTPKKKAITKAKPKAKARALPRIVAKPESPEKASAVVPEVKPAEV